MQVLHNKSHRLSFSDRFKVSNCSRPSEQTARNSPYIRASAFWFRMILDVQNTVRIPRVEGRKLYVRRSVIQVTMQAVQNPKQEKRRRDNSPAPKNLAQIHPSKK